MKWINVKNKLPSKKHERYLCYDGIHGYCQVCEYAMDWNLKEWRLICWLDDDFTATHYIKIPKFPERI